jgi:hypothetical protein
MRVSPGAGQKWCLFTLSEQSPNHLSTGRFLVKSDIPAGETPA